MLWYDYSMKKILYLAVLAGLVYFVGVNIFNSVENSKQTAQAAANLPAGYPKIKIYKDKINFDLKKGTFILSAFLETNSPEKMTINIGTPLIQKDGAAFTATSSDFKAGAVRIIRRFMGTGPDGKGTASSTFEIKKGKNVYLVQWVINTYSMPLGTYNMTFSGYSAGSSTTTVPFNAQWSKPITLTQTDDRTLNGQDYRLEKYNDQTWTNASTSPRIAFRDGKMRAKFCDSMLEGVYEINKGRLVASLKGSEGNCATSEARRVQKDFVQYIKYGMPITFNGDRIKLNLKSRGIDAEFTFIKTSAVNVSGGITRIYPCDFIGPLEEGAIRDCSGVGNVLGANLPMLTSISTTSTRLGASVNITGTNFATSNVVMFTPITSGLAVRQAVAQVATSSANGLTFTIPTTYICEGTAGSCGTLGAISTGTYRVQVKTPAGVSPGSFTLVIY